MTKKKKKKPQHGGVRVGSGRPLVDGPPKSANLMTRMNETQKAALIEWVDSLNRERAAREQKPISMATWVRSTLLIAAGQPDLV